MISCTSKFLNEITAKFNKPIIDVVVTTQTSSMHAQLLAGGSSNVTVDATVDCERSLNAEFLFSRKLLFALQDPSAVITVFRGFKYQDGTQELLQIGTFIIDSELAVDEEAQTINVSASDLSRKLARNKFISPIVIDKGTNIITAIKQIVRVCYPFLKVDLDDSSAATTSTITLEGGADADPWADIQALAKDFNLDVYIDAKGTLRTRTANSDPVWKIGEVDNSSLTKRPNRKQSFADTYNGVVVTSTSTDSTNVVQGVVWDDDPSSSTYYLGPYGKVPKFVESSNITSIEQAIAVAKAELTKCSGRSENLQWSQLVNPALEPGDVVRYTHNSVPEDIIIDKITIPLNASDGMDIETRTMVVKTTAPDDLTINGHLLMNLGTVTFASGTPTEIEKMHSYFDLAMAQNKDVAYGIKGRDLLSGLYGNVKVHINSWGGVGLYCYFTCSTHNVSWVEDLQIVSDGSFQGQALTHVGT